MEKPGAKKSTPEFDLKFRFTRCKLPLRKLVAIKAIIGSAEMTLGIFWFIFACLATSSFIFDVVVKREPPKIPS